PRRADPPRARADRAGDPGGRRLLHGAPRDRRAQGRLRRDGGALPGRVDLQLHEPGQHRRGGGHAPLAREDRLALRGADLLPRRDRLLGGARPRRPAGDDGGAEPRLLGRRARLRRPRPAAADRGGVGAAPGRPDARAASPPPAPPGRGNGRRAGRLLPVLLLHRRGPRGAGGQADDPRGGHPRLVGRLLAPLRRAGRDRGPAARPGPLTRRHPRARARDRRDGRDLQRQGRDPPGQHAERRRRTPRLPRGSRRRGARPVSRRRDRGDPIEAASPARARPRGDARRVSGPRRRDRLGGDARRRASGPERQPARAPGRGRRAGLRRARGGPPRPPAREAPRVSPLVLGVDGGNTKTIAVVVTGEGAVLGTGRAGCGDIHNARGPDAAVAEITAAVGAALAEAGTGAGDVAAAAFSLAGADWPEDFDYLRRELRDRLDLSEDPEIVNDAVGGLRCGTDDMVGVSVVIGTYSALAGRNAAGELFHFGFWPDSTGAHGLGTNALAAIWRRMLGLGPETTLLGRAL